MRRARGERGQILALVALALVVLLGICAFAIDVGYAYYAKRQLQSATDAAALAGAQDLPNGATAISTATSYAAANTPANLSSFNFTYQVKCTNTSVIATGCNAAVNPNALVVNGTASTNTWFARLFGVTKFDISAHANACSPCSSTPVDIVLGSRPHRLHVLADRGERSLHRLEQCEGRHTHAARDDEPAGRADRHGRLPAAADHRRPTCAARRTTPSGTTATTASTAPTRGYLTDQINGNYKTGAVLDTSSGLYLHTVSGDDTACIQAGGNTSYSEALRQAKAELTLHGRANVPDYIIFLTDGEANIGSVYGPSTAYPQGNADDQQPCQTAINLANSYKAQGTTIYSIGYALGNNVNCTAGAFRKKNNQGNWVSCTQPDRRLLPLRRAQRREPCDHLLQHALADRLARRLLQPAERGAAEHDLRRHRDRHRPGLEQVGGRWLLSSRGAHAAKTDRRSSSSASRPASSA